MQRRDNWVEKVFDIEGIGTQTSVRVIKSHRSNLAGAWCIVRLKTFVGRPPMVA